MVPSDRSPPNTTDFCSPASHTLASREQELSRDELAKLSILKNVCIDSIWGVLACCPVRALRQGECLIEARRPNRTLYMILEGRLSVHLDSPSADPIAFLEAGQTVGEISVIDDSPATAHVLAASPTRLLAVDEDTFWRLVVASHEFASNLLVLLARRMRQNNTTISSGARVRQQLERDAMIDALTGLHNRRWLDERLPRLVQRCQRNRTPLSVLMVDIDHFKRFNDEFGHLAGDEVLVGVARTIQNCMRPTDIGARYGGEELIIVLPDTAREGALPAAERLRARVGEVRTRTTDGRLLPAVTISIGIAGLAADDTATTLIERADSHLYRAKHNGRNRVEG